MAGSEEVVGEARERRASQMSRREKGVTRAAGVLFAATAIAMAVVLPDERDPSVFLLVGLVLGGAILLQVRFEFGGRYGSAEILAFVPLLLLAPLPLVPLLEALAVLLSLFPSVVQGNWHRDQWLSALADNWVPVPATVVLVLLAPGQLSADHLPVYLLAVAAYFGGDLVWAHIRNALVDHLPAGEVTRDVLGSMRIDGMLIPAAFVVSLAAVQDSLYLLCVLPLSLLFQLFSIDRRERYSKALELQRAYRGTVMLLSDVVESEDSYTADHSRSVVELANAVAEELRFPPESRQELEFAALLHDVGKISIEKDILNKPASLTDAEFEVMKTHTIEGQFMLDRVGGLLGRVGEIVRSCHERWDGKGYPDGLKGEDIPYPSRIVFCCDAYNAMTTDRVYRKALSQEKALSELRENAGTQFDPVVVDALLRVVGNGALPQSAREEVRLLLAGTKSSHETSHAHA